MSGDEPLSDMTVRQLDMRLTQMRDELRTELRGYVDERFVTRSDFELRMTRLTIEVVREVSSTLRAMVADAMHEVATETVQTFVASPDFTRRFHQMLDDREAEERRKRREDFKVAAKGMYWVLGFIIALSQVAGIILFYLSVRGHP